MQNNAVSKKINKAQIDYTQKNSKCRSRDYKDETINHMNKCKSIIRLDMTEPERWSMEIAQEVLNWVYNRMIYSQSRIRPSEWRIKFYVILRYEWITLCLSEDQI